MAIGSRKNGSEEYVFLNGHVMRSDEAIRINLGDSYSGSDKVLAPGQKEVSKVPGQEAAHADLASQARAVKEAGSKRKATSNKSVSATDGSIKKRSFSDSFRRGFKALEEDDAFALTQELDGGSVSFELSEHLRLYDRKTLRNKVFGIGGVLLVVTLFALCMSSTQIGSFHSPMEMMNSIATWVRLSFIGLTQPTLWQSEYTDVLISMPYYSDCLLQLWLVFKNVVCGAFLALAGMLYQNTFRNPIAAPSILGISNGINVAILVLVLQLGYGALQRPDLYFLYSFIGGIAVLLVVMLGGKAISGKGNFNTVNLILMGTVVSQLLGVIITFVQAYYVDEQGWEVYQMLVSASGSITVWNYLSVFVVGLLVLVPIVLYRFKLNLVSFGDEESRLLGVNPTRMRVVALGCGSLLMLIAQLNLGQIAMASLIIPFVSRAIFGSEFKKQLLGNLLLGALFMLLCYILGTFISFEGYPVGTAVVVSVAAIPLFVWMLAIQQRSWE